MSKLHARLLAWTFCLGLLQAQTPPGKVPLQVPDQDEPPLLRVPQMPAKKPAASPVPLAPGPPDNGAAPAPATPPAATPPVPQAPNAPSVDPAAPQTKLAPTAPFAQKAASSTSTNKEFTVYGGDLALRGAFCLLCEDTAAALGRVLKDNGDFVLPVVVVLKTPPEITPTGPAVTYNIGELTQGGFHLQINAQLRTGFRTSDFTRELVRVLLAERILRNHERLDTTREGKVLPPWVMTGVTQALEYRSRSRPSALFSAVFRRGRVYSLDNILSADPTELDALSRGIYETSTCALVLTLLDQPDGPVRFTKFLNALSVDSKSDRDLLTQYFPNLATSKSALEKWWSLQMASLATPTAMEALGAAQTEEELDNALMLQLPGAKKEDEGTAKAGEESAEKKPGGLFGWMKRDAKEEAGPADKPEPKNNLKPESATKKLQPEGETDAPTEPAEPEIKDPQDVPENKNSQTRDKPFYLNPGVYNPFGGGKQIIFSLKKKKAEEDTADTEKDKDTKKSGTSGDAKKPGTPADTKKPGTSPDTKKSGATPEAKKSDAAADTKKSGASKETAKPKTEEAVPSLPRKGGKTRSIGGQPSDLPKAAPPAEDKTEKPSAEVQTKKKPDATKSEEVQPDKPNPLNPRNWFRKEPSAEEKTADSKKQGEKPSSKTEPKTEPAKVAKKAAPAPEKRAPKPGTIPLEDFALVAKRSDRSEILNRCINQLNALKLRAHPLYKPLIAEYTAVVEDLVQGKTKGATAKLDELRRRREAIHEKAVAVETHLDFYEMNNTGTLSHAFDDFVRLDEEMDKERLPRNDALSKYLDAVEKEFQEK